MAERAMNGTLLLARAPHHAILDSVTGVPRLHPLALAPRGRRRVQPGGPEALAEASGPAPRRQRSSGPVGCWAAFPYGPVQRREGLLGGWPSPPAWRRLEPERRGVAMIARSGSFPAIRPRR
jgi:hypothetical protein